MTSSLARKMATAMQNPFPALTHLFLSSGDEEIPTFPNAFFGRSASSLQVAHLEGIQIPLLPRFLSSALGLVELRLVDIPRGSYVSPEVMVTSLAALTRLVTLIIRFKSPPPLSERRQGPKIRIGFPSLTTFGFHGAKEYLKALLSQINAPQLGQLSISYFNQLDFQVPELSEFISRAQTLCISRFTCAQVDFNVDNVRVRFCEPEALPSKNLFALRISCRGLDWQLGHLAQILDQLNTILSNVGGLSIDTRALKPGGKACGDDTV